MWHRWRDGKTGVVRMVEPNWVLNTGAPRGGGGGGGSGRLGDLGLFEQEGRNRIRSIKSIRIGRCGNETRSRGSSFSNNSSS